MSSVFSVFQISFLRKPPSVRVVLFRHLALCPHLVPGAFDCFPAAREVAYAFIVVLFLQLKVKNLIAEFFDLPLQMRQLRL